MLDSSTGVVSEEAGAFGYKWASDCSLVSGAEGKAPTDLVMT